MISRLTIPEGHDDSVFIINYDRAARLADLIHHPA